MWLVINTVFRHICNYKPLYRKRIHLFSPLSYRSASFPPVGCHDRGFGAAARKPPLGKGCAFSSLQTPGDSSGLSAARSYPSTFYPPHEAPTGSSWNVRQKPCVRSAVPLHRYARHRLFEFQTLQRTPPGRATENMLKTPPNDNKVETSRGLPAGMLRTASGVENCLQSFSEQNEVDRWTSFFCGFIPALRRCWSAE